MTTHLMWGIARLMGLIVPARLVFPAVRRIVHAASFALTPERRMRELLLLQNFLANELAQAGQAIGGGSHVKHELMGYHDFFTERISREDCVLDVGCGGGELAASIAQQTAARVIAVDVDPGNIERARHNCQGYGVEVVEADVLNWRAPQKVTVLVLSNVLEHLPDRPDFLKCLFTTSAARRALVRVPLYERDWTVPMRERLGIEWRLDMTHETEYRVPQFEDEIALAGCGIAEMQIRWSEIWAVVVPRARDEELQ